MRVYFEFDAQRWKLLRKYLPPSSLRRVKQQYRYFRWRFPDDVLLFQVGRFVECYDIGTPDWVRWLGLKPLGSKRRGACYGFPVGQTGPHLQTLLARGVKVTLIRERKHDPRGILEREPVCRYVPVFRAGTLDCARNA